ncbi:transglycosylase domain-containing protein [Litorimonas sp. RW-G-Af-16]|uniref:transglycosylase domain-containing protein n=1 Tax=Litorimonas sp. RW-G-Af-16 TaxID=3241168 RepID=UPI00390C9D79
MPTYRADIDVANDIRTRQRRKWLLIAFATLCLLLGGAYFWGKAYMLKGLPSLPDKATMWEMNLQPNMTLLDKDGNVIGHRGPYLGEPLKLTDMPDYVSNAFLAIEDERFYEHAGVDNRAIMRALLQNAKDGERGQGGSTLTQQLVKNMVLTPEKSYRRKFQEALLARDMEAILSKPEILELYLNRISLGPRVFGVEAAAQRYFGKSARDINLAEAALLAGLPQAPSKYNPTEHYDRALDRSKLVLQRMLVNRMISFADQKEALENPPVIREDADPLIEPDIIGHVFDMVDEQVEGLIGFKHKDLIITTTIDTDKQKAAQAALEKILAANAERKKATEGAVVSIDNASGAIVALIGGRSYATSKFNRAAQAKRQPGSSFKTFSYAAALEDGFTPGTVRIDQPTEIGGWAPENYTRRYRGPMNMREALKLSINTIAAQVTAEIGPARVAALANRFGIKSELRPEYSLALGSSEVTVIEMTSAYSVFANEGLLRPSYLITEITNTAKTPLYKRRVSVGERVYSVPYSRQMTSMLRDVIDSGTGHGAQLGSRQAGGKTGTSQDYRDAWFIGFTAQLTTGVWIGNDDNSSMRKITGGLLPVDVWKDYMRTAHKGLANRPLNAPDPLIDDEDAKAVTAFYSGLVDAFVSERDMASGANSGGRTTAGR